MLKGHLKHSLNIENFQHYLGLPYDMLKKKIYLKFYVLYKFFPINDLFTRGLNFLKKILLISLEMVWFRPLLEYVF